MKKHTLGTTGIEISEIVLGSGTFGGIGGSTELIGRGLDARAVDETLEEARAMGITVLDTAEGYARGAAEIAIGDWLRTLAASERATMHVATKVTPPAYAGYENTQFDEAYIDAKLTASLERLGLESVTFYLSHATDRTTPIEATLEGFAAAIESGRVAHVGCCNVDATQLREALDAAERLGIPGFAWVQNRYSLLRPSGDEAVRALCVERGLGYTPFSPLAGGVLTGKYKRNESFPDGTRLALRPEGSDAMLTERVFDALERLDTTAANLETTSAELALAWILGRPDCTAPIVGASRTSPHLAHVARALDLELPEDVAAHLAASFSIAAEPSPG